MKSKLQKVLLSPYHKIFYNEQQLDPKRFDYNIAFVQRINECLDVDRLNYAIKQFTSNTYLYRCIVREDLECCFWEDTGLPAVLESFETFSEHDVQAYIKKEFQLNVEPACRFALFTNHATDQIFVAVIHHILIDGLKFDELIHTLGELYNNSQSMEFESLEIQSQALIDENVNFQKNIQDEKLLSRNFWNNRLHDLPKGERILGDTPGNDIYKVSTLDFTLPKGDYYSWKSNLKPQISDFNIILAIFGIIVTKYNQDSEIPITYPIAIKKTDNLKFGSTINTVITRFVVEKGMTFEDLVLRKKKDIKDEIAHSCLPIYEIINLLSGIKLNISLAQTNLKRTSLMMNGCCNTAIHQNYYYDIAGNDIVLEYDFSDNDDINFRIKYREKYSDSFIRNLFYHFRRLIQMFLENPKLEIMNISLLYPEEYKQIIYNFNPPPYLFEGKGTIQEAFEKISTSMPDKIACVFGSTQLTYEELNKNANQMANYLIQVAKEKLLVSHGSIIGICLKRSIKMIIGMLAILKTGSAYLPVDPEYPEERIKLILSDANCKIILADNESYQMLRRLFDNICIINLETNNEICKQSSKNLLNRGCQHDLGYVIYTSGTTGIPKGVLIEHAGVIRLAKNHTHLQITESDCFLQASSISFDAATFEIWGALLNGATLDLIESQIVLGDAVLFKEYLNRKKITILWLTVGLFNQLATQDNTIFSEIKYLIIGGDALSKRVINALVSLPQACKPKNILNGYGPTENTTFTTLYSIEKPINSLTSIPIGSPLPGTLCYILDSGLNPVPVGVVGELYIGGLGLARGYLNRSELTKERFIQNPFLIERKDKNQGNTKLYKSGDLVRWLADGNIEFIGRNDKQIKIRGFRVELREIEAYLMKLSAIDQCVVLASSIANSERENLISGVSQNLDKHIIAYYTFKDLHTIKKQEIKEFLLKYLPAFMVPTYLFQLKKMPLTANGKLDVNQLPLPTAEHISTSSSVGAANQFELIIKEIWQEILEQNGISTLSYILDLGAHSLHLLRIAAKIQKIFEVNCSVRMILEAQTIKKLAEKIILQLKDNENHCIPIPSVKHESSYPLSFEQKRLWFLSEYTRNNSLYNILTIFKITGKLHLNILEKVILFLVNRHRSLQINFNQDADGNPYQIVVANDDKKDCIIRQHEVLEADLAEIFFKESLFEFDFRKGRLFKFDIYRLKKRDEYIFITNMHHIISDAWSLKVFFNELSIVYNAFKLDLAPQLPVIDIQYGDYAIWQKNILKDKKWNSQLEYWKKKLAGYENIRLPIKGARPTINTYEGSHLHFELDPSLMDDIQKFICKHNCTMHMLLMTVFYVLLQSYTGQDNFIIGIPVTNREHYQLENIIGFFVNLLPIRVVGNTKTKKSLLQQIKSSCIEAYSNQNIPFDYLVNELQVNRDQSISPLFQVMFNLIQDGDIGFSLDNTTIDRVQFESNVSKFDLTLSIFVNSRKIFGNFEFNTNLFDSNLIQRMSVHYTRVLEDFLRNAEEVFYEVNMLSKNELNEMLYKWNNTASFYDKTLTIDKLFEANVLRRPDAIAIKFNDCYLTYSQLNNKANQLSNHLRLKYLKQYHSELPADTLIAIYMERSLELAIAILAVIKAGCGYVPIDIDYPQERINFILKDTKAKFIITNNLQATKLNHVTNDIDSVIDIERDVLNYSKENYCNQTVCKPNNLAYVIYTSGSTGKPKGVCISHLSLNNLITSFSKKLPLSPTKKFLSLTSYIFDIFYLEFFGSLCFGAELILTDSKLIKDPVLLAGFINTNKPDIIQATPSLWQLIIDQLDPSPKLNILCGGETLYLTLLEKLFRVSNIVWNLYGPTETTIWSTAKKLSLKEEISIGSPINNTMIFILNKNLQPVPIGVDGEIYIGGDGLAREYLSNPELTQANFINVLIKITDKENTNYNLRLYKTGDFGRWLENGEIEILGRMDFQVKIRGHRIELGEIEEQLLMHGDISQCAVVSNNFMQQESKALVAYYTSFNSIEPLELKKYLAKKLPAYLVPDIFVPLKKMSLTRNGKIDRNALCKNHVKSNLITNRTLPQTDVETILAGIYCSLLNLDEVGIHDNFFDIGGHSINAMQLLTRINNTFATNLTLTSIFDNGQIADLSKYIESQKNVEIF